MTPDLSPNQIETASNPELKNLLGDSTITYTHLLDHLATSTRAAKFRYKWRAFKFTRFWMQEKIWSSLFIIALLMWFGSVYPGPWLPPFAANTVLLMSLAVILYAGQQSKARWLLFVIGVTVWTILTIVAYQGVWWVWWLLNPVGVGRFAWIAGKNY
jgi:hypothetical protein